MAISRRAQEELWFGTYHRHFCTPSQPLYSPSFLKYSLSVYPVPSCSTDLSDHKGNIFYTKVLETGKISVHRKDTVSIGQRCYAEITEVPWN